MTIRVLLADPDEVLLETYQAFLNRQGFDTCVVTTGESCLAALETFAPHVLVLEPELAGNWGIRLLSYLRQQRELPVPAVIVLTRHEVDLSGFPVHAHHLKPYSLHELAQGIRNAAGKSADAAAAPPNETDRVPRHGVS